MIERSKDERSKSVRLCIFTTMRTKDATKIPGVPLKEAMDLGEHLDFVTLVYFHNRYSNRALSDNVRVITVPYLEPKGPLRFAVSVLISYLYSIPILACFAMKYRINIFRADDIVISGFPSVVVSKILSKKCVVSMLGDEEEVVKYKLGASRKMLSRCLLYVIKNISRFALTYSDASIVVNKKLESMAREYGSRKVILTNPNIDLSIFLTNKTDVQYRQDFIVLFVGRLEPEKGPMNVLKAAEFLRDVKFMIAGYGSMQSDMEKFVKDRRLVNVEILGMVDHKCLPQLYKSSDVLLLPSYSEGLPVVMLEAMASQLPVLVSNVGAVSEILEENNGGFVLEPGNISEIVTSIETLRRDSNLRAQLGKRGRSNVSSRFQHFVQNHIEIYKGLLSD